MKPGLLLLLAQALMMSEVVFAGALFDPPPGFVATGSVGQHGGAVRAFEEYQSRDGAITVSVVQLPPAPNPRTAASDSVAGAIDGLKKKGYQHGTVVQITERGYPGRHLQGEFRSPDYEGAYLADIYILYSSEATTMLLVSIDDAAGDRALGHGLVRYVSLSGEPLALGEGGSVDYNSREYRISYAVSYVSTLALGGWALLAFIRRRRRRAS